jgi:hypothetical protein
MEEHERRVGQHEVNDKVDKLCDHIDRYIQEDRNFHTRVEKMFIDHFGELEPNEHKQHHAWTRGQIAEDKARSEFLDKIKYEVVKNAVIAILGALAMYAIVSVMGSVSRDIVISGQSAPIQIEKVTPSK